MEFPHFLNDHASSTTKNARQAMSGYQTDLSRQEGRHLRIDSSDEVLAALVLRSLMSTGRPGFSELKITASNGQVRLSGRVCSYFARQMAHETAMSVDGVHQIERAIEIE